MGCPWGSWEAMWQFLVGWIAQLNPSAEPFKALLMHYWSLVKASWIHPFLFLGMIQAACHNLPLPFIFRFGNILGPVLRWEQRLHGGAKNNIFSGPQGVVALEHWSSKFIVNIKSKRPFAKSKLFKNIALEPPQPALKWTKRASRDKETKLDWFLKSF